MTKFFSFHYLAGERQRADAPKPRVPSHSIVDDDISGKNFVNPDDIKELVPNPSRKHDVIESTDPEVVESEMYRFSPTEEREDFSP